MELIGFMDPGLGPLSACRVSACPGICVGLATPSGLLSDRPCGAVTPGPFWGIGWSKPGLNPVPEGKFVALKPGFLVFNLVMCNVDARIVDEVMWKSGCCWSCERRFWMNRCNAGTYIAVNIEEVEIQMSIHNETYIEINRKKALKKKVIIIVIDCSNIINMVLVL